MRMVIFGATSAIAQGVARHGAAQGDAFFLVGRDKARLDAVAADLRVRGAKSAHVATADLADLTQHAKLVAEADRALGGFDAVLVAHGSLTDQERAQHDGAYFAHETTVNYVSAAHLLERCAEFLAERKSGVLAAISSVAGDRGRKRNYAYGAAKAALTAHLSGLRNRLAKQGVAVVTIEPGFVDTPMTSGFKKGGPLWATPETVGAAIHRAMERRRDVVYVPWFWRGIMLVITSIPERVFKKLDL